MDVLLRAYDNFSDRGALSAPQDDKSELRRCFVQQLQQANMFERCVATMLEAAELQANADTIAAAWRNAPATTAQSPGTQGSDGSSSSSSSSGTQSGGSAGAQSGSTSAMVGISQVSQNCLTALKVGATLLTLQEVNSEGWCALVNAAAELTVAAVRSFDIITTGAGSRDLLDPRPADTVACTLFHLMQAVGDSNSRNLLRSSAVGSAVSLAALLLHAQSLLPVKVQQGSAADTGSTTITASVGDNGELLEVMVDKPLPAAGQRHALRAWKAAQRLEAPLQQPLLQTLGISMQTVGWVAGNMSEAVHAFKLTAKAVDAMSQLSWKFQQLGGQWQAAVFYSTEVLEHNLQRAILPDLQQQLQHRLLLVQLLLIVLRQPQDQQQQLGAAAAWVASCRCGIFTAAHAVACAASDWEWQCRSFEKMCPRLAALARQQGGQQFRRILGDWTSAAMPVVLSVLAGLLQEAEAVPAAAPAAAGVSSGSSLMVMAALQDCVLLLSMLGHHVGHESSLPPEDAPEDAAEDAAEDAPASSTGDLQHLSAWLEHSTAISTALEGVWRVQGRLWACGGPGDIRDARAWDLHGTRQLPAILGDGGALLLAAKQAGIGSTEQRQLFSMLCSLLKLCGTLNVVDAQTADECVWAIQSAASVILDEPSSNQQQPLVAEGAAAAAAAAEATAAVPAAAAVTPSQQQQPRAEEYLPWLVLLGRCYLYHAGQLLQLQQHLPNIRERLQALVGSAPPQTGMVLPGLHASHPALSLYDGVTWSALLNRCRLCLAQGEGMGSLAAAGYPIQSAVQRADTAIAALHELAAAGDAAASAAAYVSFARQLYALGKFLSTLPVPHACNNPSCTNMLGATELAIVSRRSCTCKGCLAARYCERACQVAHWKQHRLVCKALAAAAADASGKQAVQC